MILAAPTSPRSTSLARALCVRNHHGRYWLRPSAHAKFRLLDAAGFEAVSSWRTGDKVKRFRLPSSNLMPLFQAVKVARSLAADPAPDAAVSRSTGLDTVTADGKAEQ